MRCSRLEARVLNTSRALNPSPVYGLLLRPPPQIAVLITRRCVFCHLPSAPPAYRASCITNGPLLSAACLFIVHRLHSSSRAGHVGLACSWYDSVAFWIVLHTQTNMEGRRASEAPPKANRKKILTQAEKNQIRNFHHSHPLVTHTQIASKSPPSPPGSFGSAANLRA